MADNDPSPLDVVAGLVGKRLDRVTFGVLSDHQDREPVIPADLHLVKAAKPDADGNVTCIYCGTKVAYANAEMVDSAGMACTRCRHPVPLEMPVETKLGRRLWPWLVGVPIVIVGVVYGIWHHERAMDRAEYEEQYPYANTAADDDAISKSFERWRVDPVLAGVSSPPALSSLHLGAACDVSTEHTPSGVHAMEFPAGDVDDLKSSLAELFKNARRGRYYDDRVRELTVAQMRGPILVVAIHESDAPELTGSGSNMAYVAGYRNGDAYVYDIDGTLRCAGSFEAESSDVVKYTTWKSTDPRINGDAKVDAKQAVAYDLDTKVHEAITAGLHRVQ